MRSDPQKAVLLLLALNEEIAQSIVREFEEDDLRKLRHVAASMKQVPAEALDEAFHEFLAEASRDLAVPRGKLRYLRGLSEGALGDAKTRSVFEEPKRSVYERLEAAPREALGALLADEPPQLTGALLARLQPETAASVLAQMPMERQLAVVAHVSRMAEVEDDLINEIAAALADELPDTDNDRGESFDGVAKAAEILNAFGRDASRLLLEALDGHDEGIASDVRQAMFTFDDLARLDARAMRELLREVPTERLTYALKGAPEKVANTIFLGLSSRAADLIRDDLEVLGSIKRADVEAARKEIVQAALRLENEGRVDLGRGE